MASPLVRLGLARRAARRRRYAYAALRVIRRGLARAMEAHNARSIGPAPYSSELENIRSLYAKSIAELRKRFGASLDFSDERSKP